MTEQRREERTYCDERCLNYNPSTSTCSVGKSIAIVPGQDCRSPKDKQLLAFNLVVEGTADMIWPKDYTPSVRKDRCAQTPPSHTPMQEMCSDLIKEGRRRQGIGSPSITEHKKSMYLDTKQAERHFSADVLE